MIAGGSQVISTDVDVSDTAVGTDNPSGAVR